MEIRVKLFTNCFRSASPSIQCCGKLLVDHFHSICKASPSCACARPLSKLSPAGSSHHFFRSDDVHAGFFFFCSFTEIIKFSHGSQRATVRFRLRFIFFFFPKNEVFDFSSFLSSEELLRLGIVFFLRQIFSLRCRVFFFLISVSYGLPSPFPALRMFSLFPPTLFSTAFLSFSSFSKRHPDDSSVPSDCLHSHNHSFGTARWFRTFRLPVHIWQLQCCNPSWSGSASSPM